MAPKVMIAIPTAEFARRAEFYDYVNALEKPPDTMLMSVHGQSPAQSRNLMIDEAIKNNCTHILFLDDDVTFDTNMLHVLLGHDKDIVTGLYLRRNYPHVPLVFDVAKEDGACRYFFLKGNEERLVKIVAAGLGACLIKTHVFSKIEKPYVRLGEYAKDDWCDDIGFFNRLRAAGVTDMYCDMECWVGHIATVIIRPNKIDGKWMTSYDTHGTGILSTPQVNLLEQELEQENAKVATV